MTSAMLAIFDLAHRYHNRPKTRATVLQIEHVGGKHYNVTISPADSDAIIVNPATARGHTAVYMGMLKFYGDFEPITEQREA